MQTFLPYPDFSKSLACLDYRRCGKQRLEALQIYRIISGITPDSRWKHHPAVKMWRGYSSALALYYNICVKEWISRGYKNTLPLIEINDKPKFPLWLGKEEFHRSHRSNLLRKDRIFYGKYGWSESADLPYVWP